MSGGSYDYICYKLEEQCENNMHDAEMNDLLHGSSNDEQTTSKESI